MTFAPATLTALGTYWTAQGGINLGIVGNQKHCRGYHLGRDRIFSNCACKPDGTCEPGGGYGDYSVSQSQRDKNGLTNAASAIDLGKLNGSLPELRKFSDWLAKRCLAGHPTTNDIREVIYSPDGKRVFGFKDGVSTLILGYGDNSHLTHTHISWYRDSEARDKRPAFAGYFDTSEPHYRAVVIKPTPLWNDTTKRWVYKTRPIKVGTVYTVRGKQFQKGPGQTNCYAVVDSPYYLPQAAVKQPLVRIP